MIGVVLAMVWLAGYEVFWRSRGFVPSLTDNEALWCSTRRLATDDAVVIIGSSRLQIGLDPAVLSHALDGRPVVQLALNGGNPIPALLNRANDPAFKGVVLLEYMPRRLFTPDTLSVSRTRGFVASCANPSLVAPTEAKLSAQLQQHVVLFASEVQLIALLSYASHHHGLPHEQHEIVRADRFTPIHFQPGYQAGGTDDIWETPLSPDALAARAAEMRVAIDQIRARGGR